MHYFFTQWPGCLTQCWGDIFEKLVDLRQQQDASIQNIERLRDEHKSWQAGRWFGWRVAQKTELHWKVHWKGDSINFAWLVSSGMGWWVCLFLLSEILRWALNQHPHNKRTDGAAWQEKAISFWVSVVLYARQLSLFCSGSALILRLLNDNHHSPLYHHHHHHHHHHDQHQLVATSPLFPLIILTIILMAITPHHPCRPDHLYIWITIATSLLSVVISTFNITGTSLSSLLSFSSLHSLFFHHYHHYHHENPQQKYCYHILVIIVSVAIIWVIITTMTVVIIVCSAIVAISAGRFSAYNYWDHSTEMLYLF